MARADYCRQHGLSTKTFERWMKHLISKEEAREHAKSLQDSRREEQRRQQGKSGKRSQRPRYSVRTGTRSRALQAFWAMHVEAMNGPGWVFANTPPACGFRPTRCANGGTVSRTPRWRSTGGRIFIRVPARKQALVLAALLRIARRKTT
jgi:hypothetical protein